MDTVETLLKRCTVPGCTEPRADQGDAATNRHCRKHRAEAQKRHMATKTEQTAGRAWSAGVEAMAAHLAKNFEVYKSRDSSGQYIQRFAGPEIADIIRRCGRPPFDESVQAELP